jgi:hypothetical protein
MYAHLIVMGGVTALMAGLLSWIVARRLGARWALALPVLALAAMVALLFRSGGLGFHDGIGLVAAAIVVAAPALAGAGLGIGLQVWQRRKRNRGGA